MALAGASMPGILPSWSRKPLGRSPSSQRLGVGVGFGEPGSVHSTGIAEGENFFTANYPANEMTGAPSDSRKLKFLQKQHQELLSSLSAEVEMLKIENRDLKFRIVMRDTATPPSSSRESEGEPAQTKEITMLKQQLASANAQNAELKTSNEILNGTHGEQEGFHQEFERLSKMNTYLLNEVSTLRNGSGIRASSSGPLLAERRHSEESDAWRQAQPLPPPPSMQTTAVPKEHCGSAGNRPKLLHAVGTDRPRFISRHRSSGVSTPVGRTQRKLAPMPQVHHLPALNLDPSGLTGNQLAPTKH